MSHFLLAPFTPATLTGGVVVGTATAALITRTGFTLCLASSVGAARH